jgi:hypothetical protein
MTGSGVADVDMCACPSRLAPTLDAERSGCRRRSAYIDRFVSLLRSYHAAPDPLGAWIKARPVVRSIVGQRLEQGATRATDEVLDKLIILRAWTARGLVN